MSIYKRGDEEEERELDASNKELGVGMLIICAE